MSKNTGTLYNLFWKFSERMSAQLISLVVSVILARLLEPEHYGIISMVMIFITLANVFVSDGFGSALIQKKDAGALDYFSVLYFNIAFSVVLYLVLYICAPVISEFYGKGYELLTPVLRVLGLRIILTSVNSVQQAYVSKKMMFRQLFISSLGGTFISAIVGITMAYYGLGVWALVAQYLVSTTISTIMLCFVLKKRLQFVFSFNALKRLVPFGASVLGTNLLITAYMELRALIIGKMYSSADLAYYDKGRQFPNLIVVNINSSIGAVLFPKMANEQDNISYVKYTTRRSIRFSSYVMCPLMLGLAAVAESFVEVLLTAKWLPCVPLLRLFCIVYLFQPIHTANMQAIKAMGRGDIYMKLEIAKKSIELAILLMVMRYGVIAIVVGMAVCTILFTFVNAYPNIKLLKYSIKEQMQDIAPSILMSLIMFAIVYPMNMLNINNIVLLIFQVIAGAGIYIFMSAAVKKAEFVFVKELITDVINRKKG